MALHNLTSYLAVRKELDKKFLLYNCYSRSTCTDMNHDQFLILLYCMYACMQAYKQKKAYIIAESSTVRNMWKVICDRKCRAVIMLSDLIENGMVCIHNW